jgi:preprotein translocase subunit SecY
MLGFNEFENKAFQTIFKAWLWFAVVMLIVYMIETIIRLIGLSDKDNHR